MASTRELWLILRARDEASRVVGAFAKSVHSAGLATLAAQKKAEAAAVRQQIQQVKANSELAQSIRLANQEAAVLTKNANSLSSNAAAERRNLEVLNSRSKELKENIVNTKAYAQQLDNQAKLYRVNAAEQRELLNTQRAANLLTNEQIRNIQGNIKAENLRASTLAASAAQQRGFAARMSQDLRDHENGIKSNIRALEAQASVLRAQAAERRSQARINKDLLNKEVAGLNAHAAALEKEAATLRASSISVRDKELALQALHNKLNRVREASTLAAFSFGLLGIAGLVSLKGAIDSAVEYENQVRKTFTQVDRGRATLEEIHAAGIRVANNIAVPFRDVQEALFDIFGSMEIGMKDAEKLLGQFSKAAVAGQTDIASASRATIGIMNAFNIPVKNINDILDIQFQLVKEGIGTYEEWNTRIGLVTPSAVRAGQSLETMAAALATATRFSIPAARSATAVSRAMDAMSHPRAVEAMKKLGVNATDAKGKFRPLVNVFAELKSKLDKLPEAKRLAALLEVFKGAGGTIEARRFLQNILLTNDGLKLFQDQVKNMKGATGSFTEAYDKMAETTAMQSIVLNNKWQIMKETIGTALIPAFLSLINILGRALDWFNSLPKGTQDTITKIILFGSIISVVVGVLFGFVGVLAVFLAAITAVGASMVPLLLAISAIPIALALLGATFVLAYKKSEQFRKFLSILGDAAKDVWGTIKETAAGIREAFEANVLPPLQKVKDVVDNKLQPAINSITEMITTTLVPKIKEAGRIIVDLAEKAFTFLGDAIDKVLPHFEGFVDWITKNKESLKPLISVGAQLVKWFIILAAVIAGLAITALVGPIVAMVGAAGLLIFALKKVKDWLIAAYGGIKSFLSSLWASIQSIGSSIGEFFVGVWEAIKSAVSTGIENIKEVVNVGLQFLLSIWNSFWSTFGGPISATWGLIVAIFEFNVALIKEIIKDWIMPLVGLFLAGWKFIIDGLKAFWNTVKVLFNAAFGAIRGKVSSETSKMRELWNTFTSNVKNGASNAWNAVKAIFSNALANITTFIKGSKFVQAVIEKLSQFVRAAKTGISNFKSAFSGAASWLFNAGRNIIQGLIDGITANIGRVTSVLKGITKNIPNWKGPASLDKKLLTPTGGFIIDGLISGIHKSVPKLQSELQYVTNDMVKSTENYLEISSPSKKFKKIGQDVIRGLTKGITGTRKQLSDALFRIRRDITRSLSGGGASAKTKQAWQKRLISTTNKLMTLEAKRAAIQTKIAAAEKNLNEMISDRNKLSESVMNKLSEGADLTTLGRFAQKSAQGMIKGLKTRETEMNTFVTNLSNLAKRGLDKETIAQLAQEGVESAGALVNTLSNATDAELKEISALQKKIREMSASAGNKIADDLYAAGIKAGKGFVAGLKAQEKAITKQMESIANALIKTIKNKLGIRSPSKVFAEIGKNTAVGYQLGFSKSMLSSISGLQELMMLTQPSSMALGFTPSSYFTPAFGNPQQERQTETKVINNTFNITTQEIDPRKSASDLGWELSERM